MKLIQDSEIFTLTTYKYINIYNPYTETRYRLLDFVPKNERSVIANKMQDKRTKVPLQEKTNGILRCYKNMQLVLSLSLTGVTIYIKVL